jgi:hypothetical protein
MTSWLSKIWSAIKRLYVFYLPIRFSFLALAVLMFAFWLSDQGLDILRALAQDKGSGRMLRVGSFLLDTFLLGTAIWYWSRQLLRFRPQTKVDEPGNNQPAPKEFPTATKWAPRILGAAVFVIELIGFAIIAFSKAPVRTFMLWIIEASLVVGAAVFLGFTIKRRAVLSIDEDEKFQTMSKWSDFGKSTRRALLASIFMEIALFLWAFIDPVSWEILGVAAVLVLTIAVWVPLGSFLVAVGEYWRFPILGALIVWALLISPWCDNHVIRTVSTPLPKTMDLQKAFDDWYGRVSKLPQYAGRPDAEIPIIIVATEGGGIRAAYWTATVLTELHDRVPGFAEHCFAISGVSGGSLGATTYNALAIHHESDGTPLQPGVHRFLQFDALSGTLAAMAQPDLLQRFVPVPYFPDRARALELGWERGWKDAFNGDALFSGGFVATMQAHPLPVLLLKGTVVETGDRIVTSPVNMRSYIGFRNAFDAFHHLGKDIPLSTASLNSARFTYVTPAGKVPTPGDRDKEWGHLVDGGYFENSGGVTASEVIAFLNKQQHRVRPLVIVIDFYTTDSRPKDDPTPFCPAPGLCGPPGGPPGVPPERFANELLSPLRAVLNARSARGALADGDLAQMMGERILEFRLIQRGVPLPLGWVLSDEAMDSIDSGIDCEGGNRSAAAILATAIQTPPPTFECAGKTFPPPNPLPPVRCDLHGCTTVETKGPIQ